MSLGQRKLNSKTLKSREAIRHEALAASLIDGRLPAIGNHHPQSALARCNCRRQSCRTAADYENIRGIEQLLDLTTAEVQSPNRIPVPWPPECPACLARDGGFSSHLRAPRAPMRKIDCPRASGNPKKRRAGHC